MSLDPLDATLVSVHSLCGVPEMVVDTTAMLRDLGASEDHIFAEGWEEGAVEEENA